MPHLSPVQLALHQLARYKEHRRLHPELFGHHADGSMDGTPECGPRFVFAFDNRNRRNPQIYTFWSVHKHAWPLQFIYFFGDAIDSRGERTDPAFTIDIRDLGEHIGTNRILRAEWGSKSHIEVLTRALAHGELAERIDDALLPF
ncbi:hypothetical protein [Novosphingobium sp.]|uniref:hypothetical protein n=1 Tax=Novosphingobium sp. TaxID=1874826 RepID=UPI00260B0948|nr:hypothetical protein [Novosphingobium sp.]